MMEEEQEKALLVDDRQFRTWLRKRREEIVGYVGNKQECPLANWLNMRTDRGDYEVGREYYGVEGRSTLLPVWAWQFVTLLDVQSDGFVRGKDALEILEGVSIRGEMREAVIKCKVALEHIFLSII